MAGLPYDNTGLVWDRLNRARFSRAGSVLLALRFYGRELARLRRLTVPAMLLPALGNIGINYIAPLIVAKLVGRIAGDTDRPRLRCPTSSASPVSCCSRRCCGAWACTV